MSCFSCDIPAFHRRLPVAPSQILQIDRGASDSEIKSSYRKLSLLYHPDKNPGNEEAERMFMAVSKAYETLTDAAARENWELYGNPDGRQSLAVRLSSFEAGR